MSRQKELWDAYADEASLEGHTTDSVKFSIWLCRYVEALEQRIAELEDPWISVDERLPEKPGAVLAFHPHWGVCECYYYGDDRPISIGLVDDKAIVWAPLPAHPRG